MSEVKEPEVIKVNGQSYYSIDTLAKLTNRSYDSIKLSVSVGNRFGKMQSVKVGRTVLIPTSELIVYPFTCAGRSKLVTFYKVNGESYTMILRTVKDYQAQREIVIAGQGGESDN